MALDEIGRQELQSCNFGGLTSNRGPILFFSRYDWILDCCGDAMKKLLCLAGAFSGMKSWGEPVSFVLQERGVSSDSHKQEEEKKEKKGMSPQWGFLRLSSDGWRQVWSRRLWARLIVDDSARDHPQFVASLTLWRQLPGRNQWRGGSVTELTNLPLTGCQQCGRCHRHSHLSAGLSSSWTRREEDGRAHQLRHSTRTDDD